jgi:hypothetical protein
MLTLFKLVENYVNEKAKKVSDDNAATLSFEISQKFKQR